jgi:hypothetical protein
LCDSSGIIYNLELYSGKADHDPFLPYVGISGNVVLRLSIVVPRDHFHKIYFDNWFTSVQLEIELEKMGIQCLGTACPNRLSGCKFSNDKDMKKKKGRGSFEELSAKKRWCDPDGSEMI